MAEADYIQPRYAILELWRAVLRCSVVDGRWKWGPPEHRDSVSEAEALLCILYPATNRPELRLEEPNSIPDDLLDALRPLGDSLQIPRMLLATVEEFLDRHTGKDGTPEFSGGSAYLAAEDPARAPSTDQIRLDNVVSYATSVNLCLSVIGFLSQYRARGARGDWVARVDRLMPRVRERLTAALIGLLRSFTMNTMKTSGPGSEEGQELIRQINQDQRPDHAVISDFNRRMQLVRGRLREARLGVARAQDLENPNLLFEIGWTWSIAEDAPRFRLEDDPGDESQPPSPADLVAIQSEGYALSKPYLYFTLVALEAIELLSSERTRVLGLLDARQERLASALFIRRDLTQIYWSQLARFGPGRWPLEDLPWRTSDGVESDYLSLLVCAVVLQDLARREANEDDLRRLQPLLAELAHRSRITRRALLDDQALRIHRPGLLVTLEGSERLGPLLQWRLTDFAPLLLRRVALAASLTTDQRRRDELLSLAAAIWNHMARRTYTGGPYHGLWDDPSRVFAQLEHEPGLPSWTLTFRAVEALVGTWASQANRATRNQDLGRIASALISEAEYRLNQELAYVVALQTPLQATLQELRLDLSRAKQLSEVQPGSAVAVVLPVLRELDRIAQGRADALRAE